MTSAPREPKVVVLDHTATEGGAEIALLRLSRRLRLDGVDVRVLLLGHGPLVARLERAGVPTTVHDLDSRVTEVSRHSAFRPSAVLSNALRTARSIPALVRRIKRMDVDLVVANSLKSALIVATVAPFAHRRWAWHLHDRLSPDYLPRATTLLLRLLATVGPRMIIANSQAVRSTLPRSARPRTRVAYPGIEMTDTEPATDVESALARSDRGTSPIIGMLGRVSPTKGQREFVRAAAIVARAYPSARFRIVGAPLFGEEEYADSVRGEAARLGLTTLQFAGWTDDPASELDGFDVFVHASPVPEPFGQVIVEAMLAGTPVVATRAGGVPEIVDPDATSDPTASFALTGYGALIAPGDPLALAQAVESCLADQALADERAASARRMARSRFDIATSAQIVRAAWRECLR